MSGITTSRSGSVTSFITLPTTNSDILFFQTAATTSDSPSETSGPGPPANGLFGANGSPPLILAFLAIGLFGIAMVVVFGFRRIHSGRWDNVHRQLATNGARSIPLGDKPKLWDMWTKGPTMAQSGPRPWEHVTPFSVMIESHDDQALLDEKTKAQSSSVASPSPTPFTARARRRLQRLLRRRSATRSSETTGHSGASGTVGTPLNTTSADPALQPTSINTQTRSTDIIAAELPPNLETARALQVAVAILMPSPHVHQHAAAAQAASSTDDDDVLEYSIGTMSIPWRKDVDDS